MLQPGDFLALIEMAISYLASKKTKAEKQEAAHVRAALKRLHFSDQTIQRLQSLPSLDALDALHYEAGQAAIRQRDTRKAVQEAFETIETFGRNKGISIRAARLIGDITNLKMGVRREIEATCLNAFRNGSKAETQALLAKIKELNSMIEDLDDQLNGIILAE